MSSQVSCYLCVYILYVHFHKYAHLYAFRVHYVIQIFYIYVMQVIINIKFTNITFKLQMRMSVFFYFLGDAGL
jgi:hypothetical protein